MYLFSLKKKKYIFTAVYESKCIRRMEEMLLLLCSNTVCSQSCLTNHIAAQLSLGETLFKAMILQGKMVLIH